MIHAALSLVLLACPGRLSADAALEARVLAGVQAQAAALSCAAQAWTDPLRALGPGWQAQPAALPAPGSWQPWVLTATKGAETRQMELKLRLWPCERVQVLTQDLAAGVALAEADLAWAWMDPRSLAGRPLLRTVSAGSRLARPRRRGEALLEGDVTRTLLRAGAPVKLRVRFPGGEATDEGYLLEDGVEGRLLRAGHSRSGRIVTGRLVDGALLVED